ncbi:Methylenetetrahydrofolate reductase [Petrocella atlantisensis]|uniref:Methylenetetrahydrofolate reductase n=1 Tax=Petrocella atlantisensis TaxID=2173034 RepID=A0A3P7PCJ1_9FIRM|nr:methylenetetrahydrofolate reductase [Petrocella atlantisensis]VDN46608.1 Methylenetetrahydrofolate reductase [Petrocella atlantisensis]
MLRDKIINRESGMIFYGLTPPKSNNTDEKIEAISKKHIARIKELDVDGVIVYDIQDETERTHEERPFEFIHTVDPSLYSRHYLKELNVPRVVYRCVGNYIEEAFVEWLKDGEDQFTVFVGTASTHQEVGLKLDEAYKLRQKYNDDMLLGAVTIPERHRLLGDEDERVGFKMSKGCRFFVSQAVYDLEASKKFLLDYKQYCLKHEMDMVPIIFTLTPCGSAKTLKFIKWLGISVPSWLENTLLTSEEMLSKSIQLITVIYKELTKVAKAEGIPIGCNIESVSIRKEEIEASILLAKEITAFVKLQK